MGASFGSSKSRSTTDESARTNPWAPTIKPLKGLVGDVDAIRKAGVGPTDAQQSAFDQLKAQVSQGNPYAGEIDSLARDLYGSQSRAGDVTGRYDDLNRRLAPTADGSNLQIENNPYIQRLLQQTSDDVQSRINAQFAASGRDMSGINQQSVARGVTEAQLPVLADLFSREQGRTDAAARDLYSYGANAATTATDLDAANAQLRGAGIDVGNQALEAQAYGPNKILELEEQMKQMPIDELTKIAQLLFGAGGLGSQQTGTSTTTGKTSGFGLNAKLI